MAELSGRVVHGGAPLADCQVLAVDDATSSVVADATTGDDGCWALTADVAEPRLFARCRGRAIGAISGRGPELELGPTHALTVAVTGPGLPEDMSPQIMLTPLELDGVDASLLRWIYAPVRGAADSVLVSVLGRDIRVQTQAGRWWISAHLSVAWEARPLEAPDPVSWVAVSAAVAGGTALPASRGGFEVDVHGPTTVTIELAPTERGADG